MTDTYTMKSIYSCSDFLSDIWPCGSDAAETLDPLTNCPPEGGSTHLIRGNSADLLNLLAPTEEADSHSRVMQSLAVSSSNKESSGTVNFGRGHAYASVGSKPCACCTEPRIPCDVS